MFCPDPSDNFWNSASIKTDCFCPKLLHSFVVNHTFRNCANLDPTASKIIYKCIQTRYVPGPLAVGVKRPGREANHSP